MNRQSNTWARALTLLCMAALLVGGCVATVPSGAVTTGTLDAVEFDTLPALTPIDLEGRALHVVATTNIVGDVAAQIGGERITLTTLLTPGVDPHAYQLTPADRQQLEDADVILINGLGLEESMLPVLAELAARVPVVPVSVGIETVEFGEAGHDHAGHEGEDHDHDKHAHEGHDHEDHEHEEHAHVEDADEAEAHDHHHHEGVDPHSWQSVPNVMVWTQNIADAFRALDPEHADGYAAAADAYLVELEALDHELHTLVDMLPREARKLVTDHDSLGYLAHHYGFTIVGTVIPGLSTLAAASAQELAELETQIRDEGVRAIFVGTTVNPGVAGQLAADLGIQVVPIYTDSLSPTDGPAATYVDFMRYNVATIVDALTE